MVSFFVVSWLRVACFCLHTKARPFERRCLPSPDDMRLVYPPDGFRSQDALRDTGLFYSSPQSEPLLSAGGSYKSSKVDHVKFYNTARRGTINELVTNGIKNSRY